MERPPPGEYEQNWDTTMDLTLRRFVYGSLSGGASALLFFRSPATRWAAVAFGAGVGIGSALTDASQLFRGTIQASLPSVSSPNPAAIAAPEAPSAPELPISRHPSLRVSRSLSSKKPKKRKMFGCFLFVLAAHR